MDLKHSKVLTRVEYGSVYQGVSDEHSDHDYMYVVLQDVESFVFSKTNVAKQKNEDKYFTPQKFLDVVLNGSYDGLVMLSAQISQQSESSFNKKVLNVFNRQKVVNEYYLNVKPQLMMSLCGQFNNFYQKYKNNRRLSAKKLLHVVLCFTRAKYIDKTFTENNKNLGNVALKNVVQLSTNPNDQFVQFFVKHKRYEDFDKLANEFKDEFNNDLVDYLDHLDKEMREFYNQYKSQKRNHFKYNQKLKKDLARFILSQYAKEMNL
mgnify:FL=1